MCVFCFVAGTLKRYFLSLYEKQMKKKEKPSMKHIKNEVGEMAEKEMYVIFYVNCF